MDAVENAGKPVKKIIKGHAYKFPEYGLAAKYIKDLFAHQSHVSFNAGLTNSIVIYEENEYDTGIRYVGENPNNKVYYNCKDIDSNGHTYSSNNYNYETSCEVWRIIGVFDVASEVDGKKESRVKIVRDAFSINMSWDSSPKATDMNPWSNTDEGVNQWGESVYDYGTTIYEGADLMQLLNGYYLGEETSCKYCNDANQEECNNDCSISIVRISNTSKNMIDDAVWDTYAVNNNYDANDAYLQERGISTQYTGKSIIWYTSNAEPFYSDPFERKTTWIGKVGLIYPSDYLYANGWLKTNDSYMTITGRYEGGSTIVVTSTYGLEFSDASNSRGVRPTVYLKSGTKIIAGNGNDEPYILAN